MNKPFHNCRNCTGVQHFYDELISKVGDVYYQVAVNLSRTLYPECNDSEAWENSKTLTYQGCTEKIVQSNTQIEEKMETIELFAANNINSTIVLQMGKIKSASIPETLELIHNKTISYNNLSTCSQVCGCPETARKIIVQLKMIQWGLFDFGEVSPGNFLAFNSEDIGDYFEKSNLNTWPHDPLHKNPSDLEIAFNDVLMTTASKMSDNKLRNISILDLPAFGSMISNLRMGQQSALNWPIETNFAIHDSAKDDYQTMFTQYKKLLILWDVYMTTYMENSHDAIFPPNIEKNTYFDFTSYIKTDMESFIRSVAASFRVASKDSFETWGKTAKAVFQDTADDPNETTNGLYDKLIVDCSFRKDLKKKKFSQNNSDGGCEGFKPTLTTNGLCYTFNGQRPSEIWKPTRVIDEFTNIFPSTHFRQHRFGGNAMADGKLLGFLHSLNLFS